MKRNKSKRPTVNKTITSAAITGVVVSIVISLLLLILEGYLTLNGHLSEGSVKVCVFAIRTASLLVGTLIAAAILKCAYLKLVGIVAAGYLLTLITIGIVFFDGSFKNFLAGILSVVTGGAIALVILLRPNRRRTKLPKITI